jgi:hypothetical protein
MAGAGEVEAEGRLFSDKPPTISGRLTDSFHPTAAMVRILQSDRYEVESTFKSRI